MNIFMEECNWTSLSLRATDPVSDGPVPNCLKYSHLEVSSMHIKN